MTSRHHYSIPGASLLKPKAPSKQQPQKLSSGYASAPSRDTRQPSSSRAYYTQETLPRNNPPSRPPSGSGYRTQQPAAHASGFLAPSGSRPPSVHRQSVAPQPQPQASSSKTRLDTQDQRGYFSKMFGRRPSSAVPQAEDKHKSSYGHQRSTVTQMPAAAYPVTAATPSQPQMAAPSNWAAYEALVRAREGEREERARLNVREERIRGKEERMRSEHAAYKAKLEAEQAQAAAAARAGRTERPLSRPSRDVRGMQEYESDSARRRQQAQQMPSTGYRQEQAHLPNTQYLHLAYQHSMANATRTMSSAQDAQPVPVLHSLSHNPIVQIQPSVSSHSTSASNQVYAPRVMSTPASSAPPASSANTSPNQIQGQSRSQDQAHAHPRRTVTPPPAPKVLPMYPPPGADERTRLLKEAAEREKKSERQREHEREVEKAREREEKRARRAEREKQKELERAERAERERQKELERVERERQKEAERVERERQKEAERVERERQKDLERAEREKAKEAERRERERLEALESAERERQKELERAEREKAKEIERRERERLEALESAERERQRELELAERETAKEVERRERERMEALESAELERQKTIERTEQERLQDRPPTPSNSSPDSHEEILMTPSSLGFSRIQPQEVIVTLQRSESLRSEKKKSGLFGPFRSNSKPKEPKEVKEQAVPRGYRTRRQTPAPQGNGMDHARLTRQPPGTAEAATKPTRADPVAAERYVKHARTQKHVPPPIAIPPLRLLTSKSKRYRTMSAASLEALDGTANNTVVGSPTSSRMSPTPSGPLTPPARDPIRAAREWRNNEERAFAGRGSHRRRRPGVTFDMTDDETPKNGANFRLTRTSSVYGPRGDSSE